MSAPTGTILTDERSISGISFGVDSIRVGSEGVTCIKAYQEPGQNAFVPWFAVFEGDEIVSRANAAMVAVVTYFTE